MNPFEKPFVPDVPPELEYTLIETGINPFSIPFRPDRNEYIKIIR